MAERGGGGRAACHPRLLFLSHASGSLLLGHRLQWVESVGAGGGTRGLKEARERAQAKRGRRARSGALGGCGWGGGGQGGGQRAVPAGLQSCRHWPSRVGKGPAPGQAPVPATSAPPLYWTTSPPPTNTHVNPPPPHPPQPQKMPPKFGKLNGCQLTVLEGKKLCYLGGVGMGVVCRPLPLTLLLCPQVTPRKGYSWVGRVPME